MTHPSQDLDDTVHQRTRLGILAVLAEGQRVQFGFLQEALGLTDGNLSRHLALLENAGYATVEKGYEGRRPRTWARITKAGNAALAKEIELLRALIDRFDTHTCGPAAVQDGEAGPGEAE
jgi:DNA-binding transcriptional ArsR family regulator